jgi:hypothetical protein
MYDNEYKLNEGEDSVNLVYSPNELFDSMEFNNNPYKLPAE